jgi:hypothetical protein
VRYALTQNAKTIAQNAKEATQTNKAQKQNNPIFFYIGF